MLENFTDRWRKVRSMANLEAQRLNHEYIGTEHILLALVKEGSGTGAKVLKNFNIDFRLIRLEVEKMLKSGSETQTMGKLPETPRAKKVTEYAIEEARNLNHVYVGTEHLLLGLMREQDGVASQVLFKLGLKVQDTRDEILRVLLGEKEPVDAELMKEMDSLQINEPVIIEPKYGPEQVKTFFADWVNRSDLEVDVNDWLSKNADVKIIDRKHAACDHSFSVVLHYLPIITSVVLEPTES